MGDYESADVLEAAHDRIDLLTAEVKRLEAEVERLRAERDKLLFESMTSDLAAAKREAGEWRRRAEALSDHEGMCQSLIVARGERDDWKADCETTERDLTDLWESAEDERDEARRTAVSLADGARDIFGVIPGRVAAYRKALGFGDTS